MRRVNAAPRRGAWPALAAVVMTLLPATLLAHPGSGIAVDANGRVYFLDTGAGLWRVDAGGALTKLSTARFHWLALDAQDRFASTRLPAGASGDVLRAGSRPTLLLASDHPLTVGPDGNLYYPSRRAGGEAVDLVRMEPSARSTTVATIRLPYLNGLAAAPDGSLYYTDNRSIHRVSARGEITTVVSRVALRTCPRIPGNDANDPFLRGLAVDSSGTIYVAASGCGSVLRVTPRGEVSTMLQLDAPWSPTAIAVHRGDVYVLEYLHTAVEDRALWLPRVRKIALNGRGVVVASVTR